MKRSRLRLQAGQSGPLNLSLNLNLDLSPLHLAPRAAAGRERRHRRWRQLAPTGPEGAIVERDVRAYLQGSGTGIRSSEPAARPSATPGRRNLPEHHARRPTHGRGGRPGLARSPAAARAGRSCARTWNALTRRRQRSGSRSQLRATLPLRSLPRNRNLQPTPSSSSQRSRSPASAA